MFVIKHKERNGNLRLFSLILALIQLHKILACFEACKHGQLTFFFLSAYKAFPAWLMMCQLIQIVDIKVAVTNSFSLAPHPCIEQDTNYLTTIKSEGC